MLKEEENMEANTPQEEGSQLEADWAAVGVHAH